MAKAQELGIDLEKNTGIAYLNNGETSSNFALAVKSVDETRQGNGEFVEGIASMVKKDRRSSIVMRDTIKKSDAFDDAEPLTDHEVAKVMGQWYPGAERRRDSSPPVSASRPPRL